MCLNTTQKKPLVAKKDIICYKTLNTLELPDEAEVIARGSKVYRTKVFQLKSLNGKFVYELGKVNTCGLDHRPVSRTVEQAFHAFIGTPSSIRRREAVSASNTSRILVQCIVPKGAKYFLGKNNRTSQGIAADQLKVVKIL